MSKLTKENELFYKEMYELHKDGEYTYKYENRDGVEAFAFWDGVTYYPNPSRSGNLGTRKLTIICKSCLCDSVIAVVEEVKSLNFHSNIFSLKKGVFPCGCSKQRGKTLQQYHGIDDFIGETRKSDKGGEVVVKGCVGGLGNKRKYILECSMCKRDEELWPYGSLTTTKSNFQNKDRPVNCDCNPSRTIHSEKQVIVLVKRLCKDKNLIFEGWYGGKYSNKRNTRLLLYCPKHGMSDNTRVDKFLIREGGCKPCAQELCCYGKYKGREDEEDNLYLLKVTGCGESFYKIGRTFNLNNRIYQHRQYSPYTFTLVSIVQDKHSVICDLEVALLDKTCSLWYKPVHGWAGGFKECRVNLLIEQPEVIKTFNL